MSTPAHSPDIESHETAQIRSRGLLAASTWRNLGRSGSKMIASVFGRRVWPVSLRKTNGSGDVSIQAAQCCFLCLYDGKRPYAIQVPCIRPTPPEADGHELLEDSEGETFLPGQPTYEAVNPKDKAFESDAAVWSRMREMYFIDKGKWKRFLPFYGPTTVQEVEFQFLRVQDRDGRFQIFNVAPVDIESVRERADKALASEPNKIDIEYGDGCQGFHHSSKCPNSIDSSLPCLFDMADEARQQQKRLDTLYLLKDCAQNPQIANGLDTLKGMAQESCIYELERKNRVTIPQRGQPYNRTDKVRGIEMRMGWRIDRMVSQGPLSIAWGLFALAVSWFSVLAWAGRTDDWQTSFAFGQVLIASVSLVVFYAKD